MFTLLDPPPFLSIVSPVYRAENLVDELVRRIQVSVGKVTEDYEIILVDDRSPDEGWARIRAHAARDPRVRGLRLSRNFGQHHALTAGLDRSQGEWVVVLDCDLQDRPEEIPALFAAARGGPDGGGYDLVLARRLDRQDGWLLRLSSRLFYWVLSHLTDAPQDPAVGNFGIYHRRVVGAVLGLRESIRYFPTLVRWVGFRAGYLAVAHAGRPAGRSSYGLRQRLRLGLDILMANSDQPLRLAVKLGLVLASGTFLFVPVTLWRYLSGQITQPGYTSLILSIWFFAGLLLAVLGLVGLYVGKTFEQVKNRPLYLVDEQTDPAP